MFFLDFFTGGYKILKNRGLEKKKNTENFIFYGINNESGYLPGNISLIILDQLTISRV